jgi:hypothetical protein
MRPLLRQWIVQQLDMLDGAILAGNRLMNHATNDLVAKEKVVATRRKC